MLNQSNIVNQYWFQPKKNNKKKMFTKRFLYIFLQKKYMQKTPCLSIQKFYLIKSFRENFHLKMSSFLNEFYKFLL